MDDKKFKCRYCGHNMYLRCDEPKKKNAMMKLQYECVHCGALGPAQWRLYHDADDVDDARRKLELKMVGSNFTVTEDDVKDTLRKQLQIASGMYAGLKSGDLPSSEKAVSLAYETFKKVSFRKKGSTFHKWVHDMKSAFENLDRALSYRKRALDQFADVKKKVRSLQKELDEAKGKSDG